MFPTGTCEEGLVHSSNDQPRPELCGNAEAAEEAAFLQQAATKWTRTAFWAAQDSAHAAMLKATAESISGLSLADEDISNAALLHLELKVAHKKLVRLSI